ncbi:MAG: phosphoribosyltransferase [Sulfurospirillum sp.]|nr:MAG: phosphoribosyltransferase [Sulfurospirillum sp.]
MQTDLNSNTYLYKDRDDAIKNLLEILPIEQIKKENWLLLALSRGGAKICMGLCEKLKVNFDLFFIAPIAAPQNDECEIAMVSETKEIVIHEALTKSFGIDENYIYSQASDLYEDKIILWNNRFRYAEDMTSIKNRSVLLVDEGCESGLSLMCAIKSVLNLNTNKVSIALPVIAEDLFHQLDLIADNVFVPHKIVHFISTDYYYENLEKIKSKELIYMLKKSSSFMPNIKES